MILHRLSSAAELNDRFYSSTVTLKYIEVHLIYLKSLLDLHLSNEILIVSLGLSAR